MGDDEQRSTADKMFKDIGEAYSILSDPKKKARYDEGADIEEIENHGAGGFHMDPSDIFSMFMGGGGMGGHPGFFTKGGGGQSFQFRF
jgi:DnaJ family protein C protein 7